MHGRENRYGLSDAAAPRRHMILLRPVWSVMDGLGGKFAPVLVRDCYGDIGPLPVGESRFSAPWESNSPRVRAVPSVPIEVKGVLLGVAVDHELGVQFLAADASVTAMDQSVWPSASYAQSSAEQLFNTRRPRSLEPEDDGPWRFGRWWQRVRNSVWHNRPPQEHHMPTNSGVDR